MANGYRSLPGGSSLAKLIIERRNAWSPTHPPPLTEERILEWAREHRERAGEWPSAKSGPVHGAPGESWGKIAVALADGRRGLAAGLSLVKLLAEHNAAAKTEKASGSS